MRLIFHAALAAALVAGAARAEFREVAGTATYGEDIALSGDAVLEVQMLEIAGAGAEPRPIASITIRILGAQPFPFKLTFDDQMIDRENAYSLAARIREGDEILFKTAEAAAMFSGVVKPPEIRMVRAEPRDGWDQPTLVRSEWRVLEIAGKDAMSNAREAFLRLDETEIRGTGGCNDFTGTYRFDPPKGLSFGEIEATLRGCSPGNAQQERLIMRGLRRTASYEITGEGILVLFDAEGAPLLRLERRDN